VFFSQISEPYWDDRKVFIIGGGPSLIGFDFDRIRGCGLFLGVNDSAFHVGGCEALCSMDQTWIKKRRKWYKHFAGEVFLAVTDNFEFNEYHVKTATYLLRQRFDGLSFNTKMLTGHNSGYAALNLAFLKKCREIYLLGFDMCGKKREGDSEGDEGIVHWHKGYDWRHVNRHRLFGGWIAHFFQAAEVFRKENIEVWNCSPESKLEAFPKISLDAFVEQANR
jgi:hypothetical protein